MSRPILFFAFVFTSLSCFSQDIFFNWFENHALRIDYFLAGNSHQQGVYLESLKREPHWSGSHQYTIDTLNLGSYRIEVYDKESESLIYSNGFCTLFQEWQTTEEAKQINRAFEQVTRIPFPKRISTVSIKYRNAKNGLFDELYNFEVNPSSIFIEQVPVKEFPVTQIHNSGNPNSKLDITFIAEGYTPEQISQFRSDVVTLTNYLLSQKPFSNFKDDINIWAIESPSENEGPTNPGTGSWNSTAVGSSYYTFNIDRYLTTTHYKKVMDIAANAPGDIVYILVNTNQYGGGGIYNHYNVATSGHQLAKEVFIHELGHGLAGLGDEYYTSDVAYIDYYPLNVEPWEPNITTRVNFKAKWADMIDKKTPTPTPSDSKYHQVVGLFEGGGYVSKGVYRPFYDCRMKSNTAAGFCPVCQRAISRVVKTYLSAD